MRKAVGSILAELLVLLVLSEKVVSFDRRPSLLSRTVHTNFQARSKPDGIDEVIDPLAEVKVSLSSDGQYKPRRPKTAAEKTAKVKAKEACVANERSDFDGLTVDQQITLQQAKILRTLPLEFFLGFRDFMDQLIPRFALVTVTIHIMLLIPMLRVMKFNLGMDIGPYFYIAPLLFLLPYAVFWLWENDLVEVPLFDEKVKTYIKTQKLVAEESLSKDTEKSLYQVAQSSGELESTEKLAYFRLLTTVDVDILCGEVLAVKSRVATQQRAGKNTSGATASKDKSHQKSIFPFLSSPSPVSTEDALHLFDENDILEGRSSGHRGGGEGRASAFQGAQEEVIKASMRGEKSKKQVLEELKELKNELNKK